jgi:hypothetical protein
MATKKKVLYGEEVECNRIPVEEIQMNRTYINYVGNLIKTLSFDEKTRLLKVYNISESCNQYHDIKNVFFVKLIR